MSDKIRTEEISLVIPVKDNQSGINTLLVTFFETQKPDNYPLEIIIADNNSSPSIYIPEQFYDWGIDLKLVNKDRIGPGSARNEGVKYARGKWLLFLDSDCIPTETLITGYLNTPQDAVGYAGFVDAIGKDYISRYYVSQQIHLPPRADDMVHPAYLVTANVLILKEAFERAGGFNETFEIAGEDIDFSLRLKQIGKLDYAMKSIAMHDFSDGMTGFIKRFIKYGHGNRVIRHFHPSMKVFPLPSTAKDKKVLVNNFLVVLQWLCLLIGYIMMDLRIKKGNL